MRTRDLCLWTLLCCLCAAARAHAHHLDCQAEDELAKVATSLLGEAQLPKGTAVQNALRAAGSDLPNVKVVRFRGVQVGQAHAWLSKFKRSALGRVVCGFSSNAQSHVLVVGDRLARLHVTPHPAHYKVELEPMVRAAHGFALLRGGMVRHAPVREGQLKFDVEGDVLGVQLVGQTSVGPLPLAQWEGSKSMQVKVDGDEFDLYAWHTELHRTLYAEDGLHRSARRNRKLAEAARQYGATVCDASKLGHQHGGNDAVSRLAAQGLQARDVGEVLVRAPSLGAALGALLRSASHRLVLLDKRMTDVGFGVQQTEHEVCIVGLFASWPRPMSP